MKNNWQWLLPLLALLVAIVGGVPGLLNIINFFKSPYELGVTFENIVTGEMDQGSEHYSIVFLTMTITNKGEKPLTPTGFDFEYKHDGKWVRFERKLIPEDLTLEGMRQNIALAEPHKKDLQRFNNPISYAFPVQGFLFFVSKDITIENLRRKNQSRLICTDIFGKKWIKDLKTIGEEITKYKIYPKHGITVSPLIEENPTIAITAEAVKQYFSYFFQKLHQQPEIVEYTKRNANSHILYPEKIQFIVTTTGIVVVHVGYSETRNPKVEFHSLNVPYQQAIFGEDINVGEPAFLVKEKFFVIDYLVIGQKIARNRFPSKIDSIGGVGRYGDRLIDVSPGADVTLLNCYFHFVRNGKYESLCQEYIYINGATDVSVISKKAADERVKHICSILKNRDT